MLDPTTASLRSTPIATHERPNMSRWEPYQPADSRYGAAAAAAPAAAYGAYGGAPAYGGVGGYGAGGYGGGGYGAGGGYGGGGYGGGGGFGGGARRDLDSMQLAKPDFSNLPKFEKNFYFVSVPVLVCGVP